VPRRTTKDIAAQLEGHVTPFWLCSPFSAAFSRVINMVAGDDNDTSNPFTDRQRAYCMYGWFERHGAWDFDATAGRLIT